MASASNHEWTRINTRRRSRNHIVLLLVVVLAIETTPQTEDEDENDDEDENSRSCSTLLLLQLFVKIARTCVIVVRIPGRSVGAARRPYHSCPFVFIRG